MEATSNGGKFRLTWRVIVVIAPLIIVVAVALGLTFGRNGSVHGNSQRGQNVAKIKCASCHGPKGSAATGKIPKLAGQKAAYIYTQLVAFKSGDRSSTVMRPIAAKVSRVEFADVAAFYSRQKQTADRGVDVSLASTGQQIYESGAGDGPMFRCVMCHGSNWRLGLRRPMELIMGRGVAGAPRLDGQHAEYLIDQLNQFASGKRRATVMNAIAASMSEQDRKAVAAYLSTVQ